MSLYHHPLSKNFGGKYSPKLIEVMSFCTQRLSTCTIICFLLNFFSSFFFECQWTLCLHCPLLGRFRYEWNYCFLRGFVCITTIQPSSPHNIDSLSKQRLRGVSKHSTYVCLGLGDLHWIVDYYSKSAIS